MKDAFLLIIHLINLLVRLLRPDGMKAVAAENLLLKKQLLVIQRTRSKAPNFTTIDRFTFGWLAMMLSPRRITRSAIIIKPSTLFSFHQALVERKYLRLFSAHGNRKSGPKGPNSDLIKAIVEIKRRNPGFGCPRIAFIISTTFGIEINKDVVRRVLMKHYHPGPGDGDGPSWLSFIGNMKDSLWSIDLFCCESVFTQNPLGVAGHGCLESKNHWLFSESGTCRWSSHLPHVQSDHFQKHPAPIYKYRSRPSLSISSLESQSSHPGN